MFKIIASIVLALALAFTAMLFYQASLSETAPPTPVTMPTKLKSCPDSPNCVSTQEISRDDQRREPIPYAGTMEAAKDKLLRVLDDMPRTKRVTVEDNYVHYTFKTWPIPFIDDVEFLFDDQAKVIHYRSASRVGYGDMGVNSKRMNKVVAAYTGQ